MPLECPLKIWTISCHCYFWDQIFDFLVTMSGLKTMLRNTSEPRQKKNVRFFNESVSSGYSSTENEPFMMQNGGQPRGAPQNAPSTCSSSNTVLSNDGSFNDSVFTGMPVPALGVPQYLPTSQGAPIGYRQNRNPQGPPLSPTQPIQPQMQPPNFSPPSFRSAQHPQNSLPTIQEMIPSGPTLAGPNNSTSQFVNQVNSLGLPLPQLRQSLPSPFFSSQEDKLRERWETWMELVNLHQAMLSGLDEQTRFAKIIELSIVAVQMTNRENHENKPVYGY